jgi:hypothetical protein
MILAVACAAFAVALVVAFAYVPLRKRVMIALDPTWRRRARPMVFSGDQIAAEADNLFVWREAIKRSCDVIWEKRQPEPPHALFEPLPPGTVVHVNARHMPRFAAEVVPRLHSRIVLASGCDTIGTVFPGVERIVESPNILCWFLQNFELDERHARSGRVVKLPLGLDYHNLDPDDSDGSAEMGLPAPPAAQQLTLRAIRDTIADIRHRQLSVYANFHLSMDTFLRDVEARKRRQAREEALAYLRGKPFVRLEPRHVPRNEVWRRHATVCFEASPHGNGLDCHRTWECILLKCIPIVKTSPLDSMYDGLPVAIVQDWREVTPERLMQWRDEHAAFFDRPIPERLYSRYWIERLHAFKAAVPSPALQRQ